MLEKWYTKYYCYELKLLRLKRINWGFYYHCPVKVTRVINRIVQKTQNINIIIQTMIKAARLFIQDLEKTTVYIIVKNTASLKIRA